MPSNFLTTVDGDIILRAGPEPDSKHDFRVHKFILSLASSVFKDMFTLPQPPDQNQNEGLDIPIIDVPDSPEILNMILRFIYPGVEPPEIANVSTLAALFSAADKYNILSIYPVLKESMKMFLPRDSFMVYITACRFGFSEEAKEAARVSNSLSMVDRDYDEAVQHISGPELYRFVRFVQEREHKGQAKIQGLLSWSHLRGQSTCEHWEDGRDFYSLLEKEVGDAFVRNPCLELKDLFEVFDKIPDPPRGGCDLPKSADWYNEGGDDDAFSCPLVPMSIRRNLREVVVELQDLNYMLLRRAFAKDIASR